MIVKGATDGGTFPGTCGSITAGSSWPPARSGATARRHGRASLLPFRVTAMTARMAAGNAGEKCL